MDRRVKPGDDSFPSFLPSLCLCVSVVFFQILLQRAQGADRIPRQIGAAVGVSGRAAVAASPKSAGNSPMLLQLIRTCTRVRA
jgi:hypothetical protein